MNISILNVFLWILIMFSFTECKNRKQSLKLPGIWVQKSDDATIYSISIDEALDVTTIDYWGMEHLGEVDISSQKIILNQRQNTSFPYTLSEETGLCFNGVCYQKVFSDREMTSSCIKHLPTLNFSLDTIEVIPDRKPFARFYWCENSIVEDDVIFKIGDMEGSINLLTNNRLLLSKDVSILFVAEKSLSISAIIECFLALGTIGYKKIYWLARKSNSKKIEYFIFEDDLPLWEEDIITYNKLKEAPSLVDSQLVFPSRRYKENYLKHTLRRYEDIVLIDKYGAKNNCIFYLDKQMSIEDYINIRNYSKNQPFAKELLFEF